ncbi:MAG: NTP transferase domain-containing protein [Chloroflexota bacterium]|nr:NTP transferase domain-containing protein [Chloroflexota bacterium]
MKRLQALVLAAGDGDRMCLPSPDLPKPLLPLAGRPIIARVLDALGAAGVTHSTIVVGHRGEEIRDAMTHRAPRGMSLRFIENGGYLLGNARSLWAARSAMKRNFLLVMADHLLHASLLRALTPSAGDRCRLAVDFAAPDDPRAEEATRALVREGRVVDLGKEIATWNALDTGAFWGTPRLFDALTPDRRDGELSAVFASLARAGELDAADVSGCPWIDIDTPDDLRRAAAMVAPGGALESLAVLGRA